MLFYKFKRYCKVFIPRGFKSVFPHIVAIWKPYSIVAI